MSSSSIIFLVFGVSTVIWLLLAAWLLRLGARWVRITDLSLKRAVLAVVLMTVADFFVRGLVLVWFNVVMPDQRERYPYAALAAPLVLGLVATWGVAQWVLRTSLGKAILAWLPTLLVSVLAWLFTAAVIRPYVSEAYLVPTNAMAPTILGRHLCGTCRSCGAVGYVSVSDFDPDSPGEELGICGRCMRAAKMPITTEQVFQGDRLMAAKFLDPKRWDLIVFRYPENPSINYVKRLVGLPGEEVAIKDGDVWINGTRAQKPPEIAGLVYTADPIAELKAVWGPVKLGRDEYFVLGDFSLRSKDSRVWGKGAPGHPPYAVPKSYILGVVTHTYWPPARWRLFR